ncbi:MAG: type III-B CRISPR module RAMP protein Cmr6 [Ruminococcus sp.]|nr:type III-B CRISPR module RAMP protein Cmr6 [Ruminococcus sp.]
MRNLNLIFNKLYYSELKYRNSNKRKFDESLRGYNDEIFKAVFNKETDYAVLPFDVNSFVLKVKYPGLLIGTGNPHGTHMSDDDINMGFSFDYVTGQPYIPGSSVKGVLRSHFKDRASAVGEMIEVLFERTDIDVKALEKEIFEGTENTPRDIFFDAVVCSGDRNGRLMGTDTLAPHPSPVKSPVPIAIIKVLPQVQFEFRFILNDGILSAQDKKTLLKELLVMFGVGAKTNTGYGIFEE